ncbi:f-actin capping protein beta subunit, putative, partial [Bodo saltans]
MVERVDQAVECLICDSCTAERGGNNFWFVAAEYNRSGDFFRCPRCHAFITGHANDEEDGAEPSQLVPPTESVHTPPKFVAWFEHAVNVMMATYTRLYYAHHDLRDDTVISSCYAWAIDESVASGCEDLTDDDGEDNSAVPAEIGVVIYILHRHRGEGAVHEDDDTTETNQAAARVQNQWTSSHVASIRPSLDGSAFAFQSSVMLDIVQAQHDDDDSTSGLQKQRVHGLVATDTTKFHGRSVAVKASSRISPMEQLGTAAMVELCEHLQRV